MTLSFSQRRQGRIMQQEVPGGIVVTLRVADESDNSWSHLVEQILAGGRADG